MQFSLEYFDISSPLVGFDKNSVVPWGTRKLEMLKMNFKVAALKDALVKNREEHKEIFAEAKANYVKEVIRLVEGKLAEAKKEEFKPFHFSTPTFPTEHLNEYDSAIEMLNATTDETISLDQDLYDSYVRDKWHWKNSFLVGSSSYSAKARDTLSRR